MARICVPVCVRNIDELPDAIDVAAGVADIVEVRADCLPALDPASLLLNTDVAKRPLILTLRSPEEGGLAAFDFDARRRFWLSVTGLPSESFVDLELDMVDEFCRGESKGKLLIDWRQVICSFHDYDRVPGNLREVFERLAATPAGIIKIAVETADAVHCLPLFDLLERARHEDRRIIAVAMGEPGVMTRILGPSRGSFLTYASFDQNSGTAAGQLTAADLRDVYRVDRIDYETQIFGIMGKPVSHSVSPHIHNAAFAGNDLNAVFIPLEVHDALQFIRRMVHPKTRELDWNLGGLSVTAPHKSIVMQALDWIDPACREIGAVNTIVVHDDELWGYNTDAAGFIAPLCEALGTMRNVRCAVVGAGGAARACVWALKQEGAKVTVFARERSKAEFLAKTFGVHAEPFPANAFEPFDVVINATPVGTRGESENGSVATAEQLRGVRLAYDLVYNPIETCFIREARAAGCDVIGGLDMLIAQAVAQFKLWTSQEPPAGAMLKAAMVALE